MRLRRHRARACWARSGSSAWYVNPFGGSRAIVSNTALPSSAGDMPPAVWLTDDERYAFGALTASSATRSRLRGTLVIACITRDGHTSGVEIFYVDVSAQVADRYHDRDLRTDVPSASRR